MLRNQQSVSVFRMLRLQHRGPMLKLQHILDSGAVLILQQTIPMLKLQHGSGGAGDAAIADIVSLL